jgi:predicted amino acid-binding ACT domain protein
MVATIWHCTTTADPRPCIPPVTHPPVTHPPVTHPVGRASGRPMEYNMGMDGLGNQGMQRVALTAVGADKPGIVSALTGVLEELGCNLEDSTMSILRGQFAVLLVVSVPVDLGAAGVELALAAVAERLDLVVVVRPVRPTIDPAQDPPVGGGARGGGGGRPPPRSPWCGAPASG